VSAGDGGAIATRADGRGLLRLIDVRLDHNSAALSGGSLFAGPAFTVTAVRSFLDNSSASGGPGGGISALGRLTVVGSTFRANTSSDRGGNVAASGPFLSVRNSTLSAGSARSGGGNLFVGGVVGNRSVEASTLERGRVSGRGSGGAVQITEGNLRIVDSTLAKNKALPRGGGVSALLNARVTVFDSTVAGNRARFGAGIHGGQGGTVRVRDTLLAQNRSTTGAASDCSGDVRSLGHNVFERRCSFNRRSDIRTARPRVGRFALHGAATKTFEILRYSPAVDAGSARCTPRDQRNRLRRRR
jgi:hypothetical protein